MVKLILGQNSSIKHISCFVKETGCCGLGCVQLAMTGSKRCTLQQAPSNLGRFTGTGTAPVGLVPNLVHSVSVPLELEP